MVIFFSSTSNMVMRTRGMPRALLSMLPAA
jgi:hypothetical protein